MNKPLALVIEDDQTMAELLALVAGMAGYRTETIPDGTQALARLTRSRKPWPSMIVLDLHLPGVGGDEILKVVRASARRPQPAVIVLTADVGAADELRSVRPVQPGQTRPDEILVKPVQLKALQSILEGYRNPPAPR
jgi:CheY-like chemotaxis protein